jgi:tetratricopeptide (TPR) repeat protein
MGKFNWGSVVWHELGHVWALQISRNRVPRWFTEGLSTYEEKQGYPGWDRELEVEIFNAWHGKQLKKIKELHAGGDLLNLYLYGSLIHEFIATKWGFDTNVRMLRMFGEGKDTETVFKEALGITTDQFDEQVHAWIGVWLKNVGLKVRSGVSPEELGKLEGKVRNDPMDAESMGRLAALYAVAGRKADAETMAKKALKIDEANIDALLVLAESMGTAERRRFDKAAEFYGKAIAAGAVDYGTRLAYAKMLIKAEQIAEAIPALEEAKKVFPRYIGADNPYETLAGIYKDKGDVDNQLKQLEQLLAINHDSFKLRMEVAEIYQARGEKEKLIPTLESALYIGVFDTRLHAWLGRAYRDAGNHAKALHEFKACVILLEQAEKTAPGKWQLKIAEFKAEGAAMLVAAGKFEEGRVMAKDALLSDPSNALARKVLEELNDKK